MAEQHSESAGASVAIDGLHFPECLRWHEERLFFCDMYGDSIHSYDPVSERLLTVAEVFHPGGIGWLPDGRMLAVASEDRQILEVGASGNRLFADLSDVAAGWLNDMLIDAAGRIYVGNFGFDLFSEQPRPTRLVRVDGAGHAHAQGDDVIFPNGMVTRSDGTLVLAETFAHRLTTFAVDQDGGLRHESSLSVGEAFPDGICIDGEDHIWIASVYDHAVIRVSPTAEMDARPVSQMAFACVLGGSDGRTLFVATAPDFEPADRRGARAGRIETMRVEVGAPVA